MSSMTKKNMEEKQRDPHKEITNFCTRSNCLNFLSELLDQLLWNPRLEITLVMYESPKEKESSSFADLIYSDNFMGDKALYR